MVCAVDGPDSSVNTSDVVVMKDRQSLAGCGGAVTSLLHYTAQYTTVPLLCNELLAVLNHPPARSQRLQQLHGAQMSSVLWLSSGQNGALCPLLVTS